MAKTKVCAVPGCGSEIYKRNGTGVCRAHNHSARYCLCIICCRRRGVSPPAAETPEIRPNTVSVKVAGMGANSDPQPGGREATRNVTLPRAPWSM